MGQCELKQAWHTPMHAQRQEAARHNKLERHGRCRRSSTERLPYSGCWCSPRHPEPTPRIDAAAGGW